MRSAMLTILTAFVATAALAQGSDRAIGNETANTDQAPDKTEPKAVATANAGVPAEEKLPPGFKVKKRGDITLYCIQDSTVGTRFKTEKCYDKARLADYLLAREQNNRDFDRQRAICSDPGVCAPK